MIKHRWSLSVVQMLMIVLSIMVVPAVDAQSLTYVRYYVEDFEKVGNMSLIDYWHTYPDVTKRWLVWRAPKDVRIVKTVDAYHGEGALVVPEGSYVVLQIDPYDKIREKVIAIIMWMKIGVKPSSRWPESWITMIELQGEPAIEFNKHYDVIVYGREVKSSLYNPTIGSWGTLSDEWFRLMIVINISSGTYYVAIGKTKIESVEQSILYSREMYFPKLKMPQDITLRIDVAKGNGSVLIDWVEIYGVKISKRYETINKGAMATQTAIPIHAATTMSQHTPSRYTYVPPPRPSGSWLPLWLPIVIVSCVAVGGGIAMYVVISRRKHATTVVRPEIYEQIESKAKEEGIAMEATFARPVEAGVSTPTIGEEEGKKCPECGTVNPPYARFCKNCGTPLS